MVDTAPAKIKLGAPGYPKFLQKILKDSAPKAIHVIGDVRILREKKLAFVSSIKCPGNIILKTYDLARALRQARTAVIGGFHSPMEREALDILLRGEQPVIVCPARSIAQGRFPKEWRRHAGSGRLLILSFFAETDRRATRDRADFRNECLSAIANAVLVAHATPGGHAEQLALKVIAWKKPLYCLEDEANIALLSLGAKAISAAQADLLMDSPT